MHSSVKYSRMPTEPEIAEEPSGAFDFASAFSYNDNPDAGYDSKHNYDSAFRYRDVQPVRIRVTEDAEESEVTQKQQAFWLTVASCTLTFLSYLFFIATIPVSYFLLVKKMGEFDRMVVFRLGKMIGVKGPGRFVIFPWMDRTKKIDVRAAAFSVPPQQFITVDGGIVEMGAEIQYGIVDVVTMISEVVDHQDILRSLGKTLLVKILVKKTVPQLDRDKRTPESEICDEINAQVRKWGINVHCVKLSETKVLKQPDSGSNTAVGSILKGLGLKGDPKYPTPTEFVRASHGIEDQATASMLANTGSVTMPGASNTSVNLSLLQSLSSGAMPSGANQVQLGPGIVKPPTATDPNEFPANWGRCLEIILSSDFGHLENDAFGVYRLDITETPNGKDIYFIELSEDKRRVLMENPTGREPDVYVTISSSDLGSVLDGSLAPLQAYLTGRIQATGDVKKLMFFDKLSKRGHKPGSMFSV